MLYAIARLLPRVLLCLIVALVGVPAFAALTPQRVAPDVYAFIGDLGPVSRKNSGNVGNSGFIIGRDGVIVIDSGISYNHGKQMAAAIAKVTRKPLRLLIVTHGVQEFLFGNAAFKELGVSVLSHRETAGLIRSRCETCLKNLRQILGEEQMRGTKVVVPSQLVDASIPLNVAGRKLELLHFGWAATPGDLAVWDRASGTLFAGGLISIGRIPDLRDGKLENWIAALDSLLKLPAQYVVPGHGPVRAPYNATGTLLYLRALDKQARDLYGQGKSLSEAIGAAALTDFQKWSLYPEAHRQNVQRIYLQLEQAELK